MHLPKNKRFIVVGLMTLSAVMLYVVAYFCLVSIRVRDFDGHGINVSTYAYYHVGPLPQAIAHTIFEPAELCDAHFLRPTRWDWEGITIEETITNWQTDSVAVSTNGAPQK